VASGAPLACSVPEESRYAARLAAVRPPPRREMDGSPLGPRRHRPARRRPAARLGRAASAARPREPWTGGVSQSTRTPRQAQEAPTIATVSSVVAPLPHSAEAVPFPADSRDRPCFGRGVHRSGGHGESVELDARDVDRPTAPEGAPNVILIDQRPPPGGQPRTTGPDGPIRGSDPVDAGSGGAPRLSRRMRYSKYF